MIFTETKLKGAFVVETEQLSDERGFFGRVWCNKEMEEHGLKSNIAQANVSFNKTKGTLRGMHYQKHPYEETKVVRCTKGAIYDVIIDLRKDSETFLQWFGITLTEKNYKMLYIPEKFAHGFITLENDTEVFYLMSEFYKPNSAAGYRWDDSAFNIEWPAEVNVISKKDKNYPKFENNKIY